MSPLDIKILLHYVALTTDYQQDVERAHARSPAVRQTFEFFIQQGLLKSRYTDINWAITVANPDDDCDPRIERPIFSITDKGRAMVEHICAVQIPVCKWIQPEKMS